MTYVYVVTDIYEGELIEISAFPTFDEASARFDQIVAAVVEHDSDMWEVGVDYEDNRMAVNEAGRIVRVSAPSFGAWVVSNTNPRLREGENRYAVSVIAEVFDPEVTASDIACWLHDEAVAAASLPEYEDEDDLRFRIMDVSAS